MARTYNVIHPDEALVLFSYMRNLKESIDLLEEELSMASELDLSCAGEWCESIEYVIDELNNDIYSIAEPRSSSPGLQAKIRELQLRLQILYNRYSRMIH